MFIRFFLLNTSGNFFIFPWPVFIYGIYLVLCYNQILPVPPPDPGDDHDRVLFQACRSLNYSTKT